MIVVEKALAFSYIPGGESLQQEIVFSNTCLLYRRKQERSREVKNNARENLTNLHRIYYLVKDQIVFPEQSFWPRIFS